MIRAARAFRQGHRWHRRRQEVAASKVLALSNPALAALGYNVSPK